MRRCADDYAVNFDELEEDGEDTATSLGGGQPFPHSLSGSFVMAPTADEVFMMHQESVDDRRAHPPLRRQASWTEVEDGFVLI